MSVVVRPLTAADAPQAAGINRAAFSQFFGIPDVRNFRLGADMIEPRRRLWPEAGLALELDGELAGVALMMNWGSVCILGPITVAPRHWSKGLARVLMAELIALADRRGFAFTGLFTHPQSPKHIRLYESFGFRMQRIVAVMAKPASRVAETEHVTPLSALTPEQRALALGAIGDLTGTVHPGLDIGAECEDIVRFKLGETLLLGDASAPDGVAMCHCGPGSEASEGQMLVKFAAARGGAGAPDRFRHLLGACEAYAARKGAAQIVAGTNTGRAEAYALMQQADYRTTMNGIAMTRPAVEGYNHPGVFAIDDWR